MKMTFGIVIVTGILVVVSVTIGAVAVHFGSVVVAIRAMSYST